MMIAATALAADLTIITRNQNEFLRVAGLRVEAW
jgi:predicted nucleic acid-binding protein